MRGNTSILKQVFLLAIGGLLLVLSIGLLYLANTGVLSFDGSEDSRPPADTPTVAFVDVTVIPMDRERLLLDQTVIVRDGNIAALGDSRAIAVPTDALVIDGRGRYLMPGLVDMHVHVLERGELLLFVANGVTTIRNMWGGMNFVDHLAWREQIEQGELFGPTLYTSGPIMEGPPKTMPLMEIYASPSTAVDSVSLQIEAGYDFIKVYDHLDRPTYDAIIEAASAQDIRVVGHTPRQVGLNGVFASGQATIEHLSGFIDNDAGEYIIPKAELAAYALLARDAGVFLCPTIAVYQMHVPDDELHLLEARPEMAYVSPFMKFMWRYFSRPGAMSNITYQGDYPARIRELFVTTTTVLHTNGARFILGTDTDNPYLVPGFSLFDELDSLTEAGFDPYEALETGTRNAAEAMGRLAEFGTVTTGKRADLLLLEGNPLIDVRNVRRQTGVMLRGRWLPTENLHAMLDELAAAYRPSLLERLLPLSLLVLALYLFRRSW